MPSDRIVSPQDVLRAILLLRRQGIDPVMRQLEATEPDLTEFLLEEGTNLHAKLVKLGGTARQIRHLHERALRLAIVATLSLRNAQLRLWQDDVADTPLGRLDQADSDTADGDGVDRTD